MSKLLNPCPFCGSTDLKHYVSNARDRECGVIVCKSCGARLEACSVSHAELVNRGYSDHEAEIAQKEMASGLICDKWNLRARRTCHVVTTRSSFSQTQAMVSKKCSECGYVFGSVEIRPLLPGFVEMIEIGSVDIPNYCPNCGAKVVDE